nr:MAG TPA: Clathrin heavy chain 1 associated protein [Caudoviricetes sp.]
MLYKRLRCVCCHFVAIGRKNCIFCCFWGCFAYIKVEVIMMDQTETINGKLYLRAEDGSIVIVEEQF